MTVRGKMETSAQASSKITVVVADDEPIIVMNLKELLQRSEEHTSELQSP